MSHKQLDVYSMMIVAKYFMFTCDFVNIQHVCKKFGELNDFFHYNPIKTIQLFPNMETQYLYCMDEKKVPDMFKYMILYKVSYAKYLKMKKQDEKDDIDVEYRHITYSQYDADEMNENGNELQIPEGVTEIDRFGFKDCYKQKFIFPSTCKVIRKEAFADTRSFNVTFELNEGLRYIEANAFENSRVKKIIIPESVVYLGSQAFKGCEYLKEVIILNPNIKIGNYCFMGTNPEMICNIDLPKHAF